jgi:UDP-3-O-[3-hydroxymyristoyl] glucosamine N-acyltransferase
LQKTTAELAALLGGELEGDPDVLITGAATLEDAQPGQVSFLGNIKYLPQLKSTRASAVLISPATERPTRKNYILVANPSLAFARLVELAAPPAPSSAPGIHASAIVEASARIDPSASIGALSIVMAGAKIGAGTVVGPQCTIGHDVVIGAGCRLYPQVVVRERVRIGGRVILHSGVVIGADGFGFEPGKDGLQKIPQVGSVQIDDDVEIGANSTIDRGRIGDTRICRGVKIDNLVHIAHNVVIGENTAIAAQTGISGSTRIGRNVLIGGQVGFSGHTTVGDGASVAAQSGVHTDIPAGAQFFGYPAQPAAKARRAYANVQRIPYLQKRLKELEKALKNRKKRD